MNTYRYIVQTHLLAVVILCLAASAPAYTSNPHLSAVRTMPAEAFPGETVSVELRLAVSPDIPDVVQGLYIGDQVDEELHDSITSFEAYIISFGEPMYIENMIEAGAAGAVYAGAFPYRFILQEPPYFEYGYHLAGNQELVCTYRITVPESEAPGTVYTFPGYSWAGRLGPAGEAVFGYEDPPAAQLTVVSKLYVGDNSTYQSIQQAVDAVHSGGTIFVGPGNYDGFGIPVTKTGVTVRADLGAVPVINGTGVACAVTGGVTETAAVLIAGASTSLRGLTIGAVTETRYDCAAIVDNAAGVSIHFSNIFNGPEACRLKLIGEAVVNAQNNWWGTAATEDISTMITMTPAGAVTCTSFLYGDFSGPVETLPVSNAGCTVDLLPALDMGVFSQGAITMTFAAYDGSPVGDSGLTADAAFFDMYAPGAGSTGAITVTFCNGVDADTKIRWYNAAEDSWQVCSDVSFDGTCLILAITAESRPSLADLGGTVFGIGRVEAPGTTTTALIHITTTTASSGGGGGSRPTTTVTTTVTPDPGPTTTVSTTTSMPPPAPETSTSTSSSTSTTTTISWCFLEWIFGDADRQTLDAARLLRDRVLAGSDEGALLVSLYHRHSGEIAGILLAHPGCLSELHSLIRDLAPAVQAGSSAGERIFITKADYIRIAAVLNMLASHASPQLAGDLDYIRTQLVSGEQLKQFGIYMEE